MYIMENTDRYVVKSINNGLAYELINKITNQSVLLQGDDAVEWFNLYNSINESSVNPNSAWYNKKTNYILSALIDDYLS